MPFTKTLGPISARLIDKLLNQGKSIFTLDEAMSLYAGGRAETIKFLSDLVKRGILARLKPGAYLILQMGQESAQLSNWAVIAHELAGRDHYFISYYSAMRLHGMTIHPLLDIYITMPKRCSVKKINHLNYHFIYAKPEHFWGSTSQWVSKCEKVFVSDLERTLLDGLDRPDLCGGIKEMVQGIWAKHKEIDWEKMMEYALRFHSRAAVKRLGFILEILSLEVNFRSALSRAMSETKDYILLDPYGLKEGKRLSRWHIRLNMSIEELKVGIWG